MQTVKFFKEKWSDDKKIEFNNILHENASSYNQIIYDIDEPADKIYLIKSGKAIVETLIHINEENTYPIVIYIIVYFYRVQENGKKETSRSKYFTKFAPYCLETSLVLRNS